MTIGIYCLRFKATDKVYIGQSVNIEKRYKEHLRLFASGNGKKKLQDAAINKLLDAGVDITFFDNYTTTLGPLTLWTSNFPYSYGEESTIADSGLPSRRTAFRLYDTIASMRAAEINSKLSRIMKDYE